MHIICAVLTTFIIKFVRLQLQSRVSAVSLADWHARWRCFTFNNMWTEVCHHVMEEWCLIHTARGKNDVVRGVRRASVYMGSTIKKSARFRPLDTTHSFANACILNMTLIFKFVLEHWMLSDTAFD